MTEELHRDPLRAPRARGRLAIGLEIVGANVNDLEPLRPTQEVSVMTATRTASLVHQYASMKPTEFGKSIKPKWKVGDQLSADVQMAVEKGQLTPLDGARVISAIVAALFGYDELILRDISPETSPPRRAQHSEARRSWD